MKALAVIYTLSLLLGSLPRQSPLTSPRDDSNSPPNRHPPAPRRETIPPQTTGEQIDATEARPLTVRFEIGGGETSRPLPERLSDSGPNAGPIPWGADTYEAETTFEPEWSDYADWLIARLDDMEPTLETTPQASVTFYPLAPPTTGKDAPTEMPDHSIPLYDAWVRHMEDRPPPRRAKDLLPTLREAFAAEGVPEALVWIAETESTFNPRARNPLGARGLFQIMPDTALSLGLSVGARDQRLHPTASARAAARYLKHLHTRFGDWPLALAAYNGGETRVARALATRGATTFASIADHLPTETRLYVPKVLATVQVRTGLSPEDLPAPM